MKHTETYAFEQARQVLNNEAPLWEKINSLSKQAHAEGWTREKLATRIRRAALYMVGYSDSKTPPISRRSIQYWADMTACDEV